MKRVTFWFVIVLLLVACGGKEAVVDTAVVTQSPPQVDTLVVIEETIEPIVEDVSEETAVEESTPDEPEESVVRTAVLAPPHGQVAVDNMGPALADLGEGWTRVEPGGDTRCALDTDYAYYVKPGSVNKLLLYFEGGGGCWDAATCAANSTFYDDDVGSDEDPARRGGVFDLDHPDNPFSDYHAVFIPSCTGDVHWGNAVQEFPKDDGGTLTMHYRGFVNAAAALDWAYNNVTDPDSVFVTGCSAGSVGSRVHVPYVIEQYPEAQVTQLGDSLAFVFGRPINVGNPDAYDAYHTFPDWIPALEEIKQGRLLMADYDIAIANYYENYTLAQYNTENDNVQVRFYEAAAGGEAANFVADLAAHLTSIHEAAPNFRSYTPSGDLHCIMPRPQFYTTEVDGVKLTDWVRALADGEPVSSVKCETCQNETEVTLGATEASVLTHLGGEWTEVGTMPTPRSENRGVVIGNTFYIPGGWGGESVLESYDPVTGAWARLADLPNGRHHFMTTAYNNQLYLFGGSAANAYSPNNNAWRYDPVSDSWTEFANLPTPRMGGAAVTLGDAIYIVGGETEGDEQPTYRYDSVTDSYAELAELNQKREHVTAVALNNKIYVIGGWWRGSGELTSLEIYDPETDSWTNGAEMSVARGGLAAVVLDDKIFVAGGEILSAARRTENSVEVYDPATDSWEMAAPLPVPIHGFPFLEYADSLWIIGGSDQAGASVNRGRVLRYAVLGKE